MSPDQWMLDHYDHEKPILGLERLDQYFERFKDKFKSVKIITVAGTNGKGETCFALESLLITNGYKTALWSSPHITSITERFRFCGVQIGEQQLIEHFKKLGNLALSYYEFLFLAFCDLCSVKKIDVIILEVGLGGRLDAVNYFDADLSCITSISRDHQAILGNSYKKILNEKIGISRTSRPLVTCFQQSYLKDLTEKYCKAHRVNHFDLIDSGFLTGNDPYPRVNKMLALALSHLLTHKNLQNMDLKQLNHIPSFFNSRREKMTFGSKEVELIGAHNLDGFRKLIEYLYKNRGDDWKKYDTIVLSFSQRPIEDIVASLKCLMKEKKLFGSIKLTSFNHSKAMAWKNLKELPTFGNVEVFKTPDFRDCFKDPHRPEKILVLGSYYFIGELKRYFSDETKSNQI